MPLPPAGSDIYLTNTASLGHELLHALENIQGAPLPEPFTFVSLESHSVIELTEAEIRVTGLLEYSGARFTQRAIHQELGRAPVTGYGVNQQNVPYPQGKGLETTAEFRAARAERADAQVRNQLLQLGMLE